MRHSVKTLSPAAATWKAEINFTLHHYSIVCNTSLGMAIFPQWSVWTLTTVCFDLFLSFKIL